MPYIGKSPTQAVRAIANAAWTAEMPENIRLKVL